MMKLIWFLCFVAFIITAPSTSSKRRVCYYTNWSQYRWGIGHYNWQNYEDGLCTHIIYSFGKIIEPINGVFELAYYEWNDSHGYKGVRKMIS